MRPTASPPSVYQIAPSGPSATEFVSGRGSSGIVGKGNSLYAPVVVIRPILPSRRHWPNHRAPSEPTARPRTSAPAATGYSVNEYVVVALAEAGRTRAAAAAAMTSRRDLTGCS